jgi:sulfhydrogenase subunit beta (sulfur reductase)
MSGWKQLDRADLAAFLAELARGAEVMVPQDVNGKLRFAAYDATKPASFPSSLVDVSPKALFFPKRRPVAQYDAASRKELVPVEPATRPRIVLGLHPCDAAAVAYTDRVFLGSFRDALYAAERDRTTLIGMACTEMKPECHCTDRELAPDDERNLDAIFHETKDGWLFRALTDKGAAALKSSLLKETAVEPKRREWPKGKRSVARPEQLLALQDDDFWNEVSSLCLACGACTFACPTCTCFLVSDEKHGSAGERVTAWDSCQFAGYARMTGGHNPRKAKSARVRNRMLDKFCYTVEKYGAMSCVGCGRCAVICPVGRNFPREIAELSRKAKS